MKIEFLYHWQKKHGLTSAGQADRLPAALCAVGGAPALAGQPARHAAGRGALAEKLFGLSAKRSLPAWRSDTFMAGIAAPDTRARAGRRGAVRRHLQQLLRARERAAALRVLQAAGYKVHVARPAALTPSRRPAVLRPHLPRQRPGRPGQGGSAPRGRSAAPVRGARRAGGRARAVLPADPARRIPRRWAWAQDAEALARRPCCSRNSWRASTRPAA